ncbi:hypothetical protein SAMN05880556_11339 [Azospirillum sp. RU38E]|nr:hypothetical protein SAMN05880556_11339 [Azospirillum sp. RU38E]SNT01351.1 hypothetical protein SAMN05880591_11338 [Azospirillum sp. RU37A]
MLLKPAVFRQGDAYCAAPPGNGRHPDPDHHPHAPSPGAMVIFKPHEPPGA